MTYEERLTRDLDRIRERTTAAGHYAANAFESAVKALLTHDQALASQVVLGDHPLNREVRALDALCHAFIARHLPSAGHLRFVSAVLRINVAVERIGDYAVTIGRETAQLSGAPPAELAGDIEAMARQSRDSLRQALDAFASGNAEMARGTIGMARQVKISFDEVFGDLLRSAERSSRPLPDLFTLLAAFGRIVRVGDQAKNICEETIFAEIGETKAPKRYRVVFVDATNDCLSLMAEEIARKAFPASGSYASCGWQPAAEIDAGFIAFMDRMGHDVAERRPTPVSEHLDPFDDVAVLVSLQGDPRPHIGKVPFHTVLQIWDVGTVPQGLDRERADAALSACYRRLASQIEDLMTTLRGDEAS